MFKSMTAIQPVCKEIQSQQPQLSETMATACALLAMAEFKEKIRVAFSKQLPGTYIANPYRTPGA